MTDTLIDKNLTIVNDIAKLFIGSEGHPLTDKQQEAIARIIEIARTTKNPEVLKTIMKQECFKSNLDILLVIAQNPKADADTLKKCAYAIGAIAENLEDDDKKMVAIKYTIIPKIAKNSKANADTLEMCTYAIEAIAKNLKDDYKKMVAINTIIPEIAKNSKAIAYTLEICAYAIGAIAENLEDDDKKMVAIKYTIIPKIAKNPKANADTLCGFAYAIGAIAENLKDDYKKMVAINTIIIPEIVKNPKANADTLRGCAYAIRNIAENLKNSDLKRIANKISQIITEMRQSMQPSQTIQNMLEEQRTQFFKNINDQITKMNQKMKEIREEEVPTASRELFAEPKQPDGSSSQVKVALVAAAVASVNTPEKENEETPLIPKKQKPKNPECIIM